VMYGPYTPSPYVGHCAGNAVKARGSESARKGGRKVLHWQPSSQPLVRLSACPPLSRDPSSQKSGVFGL
jgi:hypothetical protein